MAERPGYVNLQSVCLAISLGRLCEHRVEMGEGVEHCDAAAEQSSSRQAARQIRRSSVRGRSTTETGRFIRRLALAGSCLADYFCITRLGQASPSLDVRR